MAVFDFDSHDLLFTAIVTIGFQLAFFAIAASLKIDKVTDFAGGLNFIALAIISLVSGGHYHTRQLIAFVIVVASRAELGFFLLYRVLKRGKDARFDEIRENFWSFLGFWVFQMIWVWGVSISFVYLNTVRADPDLEARDYIGAIMAGLGFIIEAVADLQKNAFRSHPENRGRVCSSGLWSITRHPNYFGEMLLWWGIFVMCTPVFKPSSDDYGYICIISPILTMLILLFLSGMPTAEGESLGRFMKTPEEKAAFERYRNRTPILIPFPPPLYACFPRWLKIILCFEYPMYEYKPQDSKTEALSAA